MLRDLWYIHENLDINQIFHNVLLAITLIASNSINHIFGPKKETEPVARKMVINSCGLFCILLQYYCINIISRCINLDIFSIQKSEIYQN